MRRKNWTYLLKIVGFASALLLTLPLESLHAATVPDIRGTWTFSSVSLEINCLNSSRDFYNLPGGTDFNITNQTSTDFTVTILDTVMNGGDTITNTGTCSGTVSSDGTVSESCTYVETVNGGVRYSGTSTLTGSLVGNTLTYTHEGQDLTGSTCQ
ncbi:MAG: hypothetical protein WAU17_08140, partial [Nitrospirales bacterium]